MLIKNILLPLAVFVVFSNCYAENINPYDDDSQYAYGENIGWLNADPNTADGVQVASDKLTGYIWAENIGWINLSPTSYGGILNDVAGVLSGFAWGENVGWINFNPVNGGVTIDSDGNFDGWAYGENIGWIHFSSTSPIAYGVDVCVVKLDDLQNFAYHWLDSGVNPADLDGELDDVDLEDFGIFSGYWLDFCPDGWQLK